MGKKSAQGALSAAKKTTASAKDDLQTAASRAKVKDATAAKVKAKPGSGVSGGQQGSLSKDEADKGQRSDGGAQVKVTKEKVGQRH